MSTFGDINITTITPGTGATSLGKAEDAAHTTGDVGVMALGVYVAGNDTAQVNTAGDYGAISLNDVGNVKVQLEPTRKATYFASTGAFTAATSATDVWQIFGSASKIVKIIKIYAILTDTGNATATYNSFSLIKRNTANSSGTPVNSTVIPLDSANATGTAAPKHYTANPTTGGSLGSIRSFIKVPSLTSGSAAVYQGALITNPHTVLFDADQFGQPIVLRGTGEGIVLNFGGVTQGGTSPQVSVDVVWTEE